MPVYNSIHTGEQIDTTLTRIVNLIYPVGSIYMSLNATNPEILFGGTWEQIQDTFLLAAGSTYTVGDTGGEATHTLTINEMPSHNHGSKSLTGSFRAKDNLMRNVATGVFMTAAGIVSISNFSHNVCHWTTNVTSANVEDQVNINATHTHNTEGDGQAHNNMPPYLAVYMWKRTA